MALRPSEKFDSEAFVRAIAERRIFGSFALAQTQRGFLHDLEFARLNSAALVGTIAEGAVAGLAASAPEIAPCFEFESHRHFRGWYWIFLHKDLWSFQSAGCIPGDHFPGVVLGLTGDR